MNFSFYITVSIKSHYFFYVYLQKHDQCADLRRFKKDERLHRFCRY